MTRPGPARIEPGLPPSARARLRRSEETASRTSFLGVSSAFGLHTVGLDPIGDVMGCIAFEVSHQYFPPCGTRGIDPPKVRMIAARGVGALASSYVRQFRGAYETALTRLRSEAIALGADGVVGIRLTRTRHEDLHEIVALGTAVRARSSSHTSRPFTTDLGGADVARLMLAGWAPVTLIAAVQVGLRHNDYVTLSQVRQPGGRRRNVEVAGFTELRQATVAGARGAMRTAAGASGADGSLLSGLEVDEWQVRCMQQSSGTDHVSRVIAIGTAVARFGTGRRELPTTLAVLPVDDRRRTDGARA